MDAVQFFSPSITASMADLGNGNYTYIHTPTKPGVFTLKVMAEIVGGLYAEYFQNPSLSGNPSLSNYTIVHYDWDCTQFAGSGADNSATFYGHVLVPTTDSYKFTMNSDDG
mmetsp:Transcript_15753/g.18215  ORF Transcript_15753/g.18215 Transcript_15753/m.18215 type:complete len:111 (-) Transcript_15753:763-1095(-)